MPWDHYKDAAPNQAAPAGGAAGQPNPEKYYQMIGPDGKIVGVPFSKVKAANQQHYSFPTQAEHLRYGNDALAVQPQEGGIHSMADQVGLPTLWHAIRNPGETAKNLYDLQNWGMDPDNRDGGAIGRGITGMVSDSAGHLKQARDAMKAGETSAAAYHAFSAIPVIGPGMNKAIDQLQIPDGDTDDSYGHRLYQTVTSPGTMGTLVGLSAALAGPVRGAARGLGAGEALTSAAKAITPDAVAAIPGTVGSVLRTAGAAQKAGAVKDINRAMGVTGKQVMKGPNPGLAYFNDIEPLGISRSYGSIAQKASDLVDRIRDNMDAIIDSRTAAGQRIPVESVLEPFQQAAESAASRELAAGNLRNLQQIKDHVAEFEPQLEAARNKGGLTPSEVNDLKQTMVKKIDTETTSPSVIDQLRQAHSDAMHGLLGREIPELGPLRQTAAGLEALKTLAEEADSVGMKPPPTLVTSMLRAGLGNAVGRIVHHPTIGAALGGAATIADNVPLSTAAAAGRRLLGDGLVDAGAHLSAGGSIPGTGFLKYTPLAAGDHRPDAPNSFNNAPQTPRATFPAYTPQGVSSSSLKGPALWAAKGADNLTSHLQQDSSSGLTPADIQSLQATRQGQMLLTEASNFSPGTPAMRNVVAKITALGGGN